jgi:hypothetical protein
MPKINECLIDVDLANAIREVADALKLKVPAGKLGFRCPNPKCRRPVKPMVAGGKQRPHFEYLKRNPNCDLQELSFARKPRFRDRRSGLESPKLIAN